MREDRRRRYDDGFRREALELIKAGAGKDTLARRLAIPVYTARNRIRPYRSGGEEAVMGGNGSRRYDWETKVAAARDHVENGMTKTEAMARHGIASIAPLERWCREYRAGGPEALRPKPKGRPKGARSRPKPKPFCKVKRPGELRKLMGVWVEEIDALAPSETIDVHGDTVDAKGEIVASIIHREGAECLVTYGGDEFYAGHSALTVNAYGKGKAYFVGTPLDETGMSAFMAPIIKELDLKSLDTPEDVSLSVRYGDGGTRYAFLINNSAADKRLCLSELNGGTELLAGTVINDLIELKPYGVDVIALR